MRLYRLLYIRGARRNGAYGTGSLDRKENHFSPTIFLSLLRATLRARLPRFAAVAQR